LRERFNGLPNTTERIEVEEEVARILAHEGFLSATASATVHQSFTIPDRAILNINRERRSAARIADWDIRGTSPLDPAKTLARLGLAKGEPYRDRVLSARLSEIRDELRKKHFYQAVAQNLTPTVSPDGTQVFLVIVIEAGPLVEWHVTGKLPGSEDDFIPIKRQNSVDRDLLADARDDIVEECKRQGYFRPQVAYVITQPTPESPKLVVNFTVDCGIAGTASWVSICRRNLRGPRTAFQAQKDLAIGAFFNEEGVKAALDAAGARRSRISDFIGLVDESPKFWRKCPARHAPTRAAFVIHPKITEGPPGHDYQLSRLI
jgi:hypothetical protein